jgi:hypothetical protein
MSNPNAPIAWQYKANGSINLFVNSQITTLEPTAINYKVVLESLQKGDWDSVRKNLSVKKAIADHTNGRVEIFGDEIHVDGKVLPTAISTRVLTLFRQSSFNLAPVFRFLENVQKNPEQFSRDELYLFLEHNELPITIDGHFLAYKMVRSDYYDIHTGNTFLNRVGDKPSMPREQVTKDRNNTCAKGLHFCAYSYLPQAYGLSTGERLMVVKINPADVVSIPSDYNNAKGRCWLYEVVDEIDDFSDILPKRYTTSYADPEIADEEEEDEDFADMVDDLDSVDGLDGIEDDAPVDYSVKLDASGVKKIRVMLKQGWKLAAIAAEFNISARQVARIRDGEAWADVK